MSNLVIITLAVAALAAWIAWLIYNYAVFNKQVAIEAKVDYWKNRTKRVQDCIEDLIKVIRKKLPYSNVQYVHNDEVDEITGTINSTIIKD